MSKKVSKSSKKGLFAGRLNRTGFFINTIGLIIASIVAILVLVSAVANASSIVGLILLLLLLLGTSFYASSFAVRRLHDFNRSGYWSILYGLGFYASFSSFLAGFSAGILGYGDPITGLLFRITFELGPLMGVLGLLSICAKIFAVALVVWPGNKKANSYSEKADGITFSVTSK